MMKYILLFPALEVQVLLLLRYYCFKVIIVISFNITGMKRTEILLTIRIPDYIWTQFK